MAANTCNCINLHDSGCSYLTGETCFEQGCGSLKNADRNKMDCLRERFQRGSVGNIFVHCSLLCDPPINT